MPLPADFIDRFRKPLFFAVAAAIGCLAMALIAELFLLFASQIAPPAISRGEASPVAPRGDKSPRYVCLTIDISGSMEGTSLTEVKKAASKFVENRDFSRDNIAITVFSTDARVLVPLTNDKQKLLNAIDAIACEGLTNFNAALEKSEEAISPKHNPNIKKMVADVPMSILFFTDGEHCVGDPLIALAIAERLRTQEKIKILAVATDEADFDYLEALTGDKDSVISVRGEGFQNAFDEAEKKIFSPQLLQSGSGENSNPLFVLLQVFVWSTLLCFGIAIGIVGMQNNFLQKQFMTPSVALGLVGGSVVAGVIAGGCGQVLFYLLATVFSGGILELTRIIAWGVLGALMARIMTRFIPNMNTRWAWYGGTLGGVLGAIAFLCFFATIGELQGDLWAHSYWGLVLGWLWRWLKISVGRLG